MVPEFSPAALAVSAPSPAEELDDEAPSHEEVAPFSTGPGDRDLFRRFEQSSIKRDELPRLLGYSQRAIANWLAGRAPSDAAVRRLRELDRLLAALSGMIRPEAIGPWLREPSGGFNGSTPLQVIERGEWDRIWLMIHEVGSGQPG